eukprot:3342077-Amphidinium_carterae.1
MALVVAFGMIGNRFNESSYCVKVRFCFDATCASSGRCLNGHCQREAAKTAAANRELWAGSAGASGKGKAYKGAHQAYLWGPQMPTKGVPQAYLLEFIRPTLGLHLLTS